jgi:hypothetical protein
MPIDGKAAAPYGPPLSTAIALSEDRLWEKITLY